MNETTPPTIALPPQAEGGKKIWWKSRVLWFNALVAVLAIAEAQTAQLAQILSPHVYPYVALGVAAVNAVLRVVTATGLTLK